jgi:hypothetical protein
VISAIRLNGGWRSYSWSHSDLIPKKPNELVDPQAQLLVEFLKLLGEQEGV